MRKKMHKDGIITDKKGVVKGIALLIGIAVLTAAACIGIPAMRDRDSEQAEEREDPVSENKTTSVQEEVSKPETGSTPFVEYSISGCVTLGDYEILEIKTGVPSHITETDLDSYIESVLAEVPDYTPSDRETVCEGCYVDMEVEEKAKGSEEPADEQGSRMYGVGNGDLQPSFEKNIIGMRTGETSEFTVRPEGDSEAEEYSYVVKINGIYEAETYDMESVPDEFLYREFGSRNMDEFRAYCLADMYSASASIENAALSDAFAEYEKSCKVRIPDGLLDQKYGQMKDILKTMNGEEKIGEFAESLSYNSVEDLYDDLRTQTAEALEDELICEALWEKLGMEMDDKEFESYLQSQASAMSIEDIHEYIRDFDTAYESGEEYMRRQYVIQSMKGFIASKAQPVRDEEARMTDVMTDETKTE